MDIAVGQLIDQLPYPVASDALKALADVVVLVDSGARILDVQHGIESVFELSGWVGMSFLDTVCKDTRGKAAALIEDRLSEGAVGSMRWRQVNQARSADSAERYPVEYTALPISDTDECLLLGRNLRSMSDLHDRLMTAQIAVESEYERFRAAESLYRDILDLARDPVLLVSVDGLAVLDGNAAARTFFSALGVPIVFGRKSALDTMFAGAGGAAGGRDNWQTQVLAWLKPAVALRQHSQTMLTLDGVAYQVSVHPQSHPRTHMHAGNDAYGGNDDASVIVRFAASGSAADRSVLSLGSAASQLPDAFVVIDANGRVRAANASFADLVGEDRGANLVSREFDDWLELPGLTTDSLYRRLQDFGKIRSLFLSVRHRSGVLRPVDASVVAVLVEGEPVMGIVMRESSDRADQRGESGDTMKTVVGQMSHLVGRLSMKEIVREAADVIEDMCIQAALEMSDGNRAAAAEMLGISRQNFYMKLRRMQADQDGSGTSS